MSKELAKAIEELTEVVKRDSRYSDKLAEKALDLAMKAITKVEAMEKSTHKAYFLPATSPADEMNPPHPHEPSSGQDVKLEEALDRLFEQSRGSLDSSGDVFLESND